MFGINLRAMAHQTFGTQRPECALLRQSYGAYKAGLDQGREVSVVEYRCRAYREEFARELVDNRLVFEKDCIIRIYADSLPSDVEPTPKDKFRLDDGVEYVIIHAKYEGPAKAMHVLHARGPG